ncbi:MAG: class I SAM-dependent methyltransferase [Acidobacteria bacterium]|nr:class I SAM-dependent methyltransferase [Acidobacteriota bacterium]
MSSSNIDAKTVEGFGEEWSRFDQSDLDETERLRIFDSYFRIFPWDELDSDAVGFDLGCGSGRWAKSVAPQVGRLHCIDASRDALEVARRNLGSSSNCEFHNASVDEFPLPDGSMDFGYSLGVLHHIPDPLEGIRQCVAKLKPGAPFLIYLYYAFDNRPGWFRGLWFISDVLRRMIAALPARIKHFVTDVLALTIYVPFSRVAGFAELIGFDVSFFPLANYRDKSFYTLRTDALDRFGTRLEFRFTRIDIEKMLSGAGLERIEFSDEMPHWCAVGFKK